MATSTEDTSHDLVGGPFAVIESDPGVFTALIRKLGVRGLEVTEIYDIEPWAVDHLEPHGLIFCYLCTDDNEAAENIAYIDDPDAEVIWFANQLSNDACSSQALLNVLLNCPNVELGEELREFRAITEQMSPVMRGLALSGSQFIREAQNSLARPADIRGALHSIATTTVKASKAQAKAAKPPPKKRKVSSSPSKARCKSAKAAEEQQEVYHFIGYVPARGRVWELDGLRKSALEVGELGGPSDARNSWMDVVRPALRMRMQQYTASESDHIRYNLLAIVDDRYCAASDKLELLKRERNTLERRLRETYPEGWADKVDQTLYTCAADAFATCVRPASEGTVFSEDFGSRKMDREIAILDMPARSLPTAWEACVQAALSAKVAVEDEITKAREANTEQIKRTFDYEPFITQFITCLHNEGLLEAAMQSKPAEESPSQSAPARGKGRGKR
ncbi:cysteine proteinase [Laetiporus sulphureus 93-53]|uniref:ubiquitinyl hydrolase 1 n=1 Tax=Laetiporus sulphureus 93-53 TaxID=1314785 RepID=A0A165BZE0_9APHY|nr:cysteine proteinase [Laetiporus sulphureus 93-53]KZT01927.1 cysteine proteinase [Laetiporus sulphureus 93-53]